MIKHTLSGRDNTSSAYVKPRVEISIFEAEQGFQLSAGGDLDDFEPENQL